MTNFLFISLNDHVSWGGSEVLWSKTALQLSENNNVSVLVKKWNVEPAPITHLREKGVSVFCKDNFQLSSYQRIKNKIFRTHHKRKHHLEQVVIENMDLVVISMGHHLDSKLFYYTDYLKRFKKPFAIVFQLVTAYVDLNDHLRERFKKTYKEAERLYFLSKDNIGISEAQMATYFENKVLINNPFDMKTEYLSMEIKTKDRFYLGCVAALNSFHKGQDILLKVLSSKKWKERPLFLNLYGNGGNKKQIQELIDLYGLENQVFVRGYVGEKKEIWKQNHGLILPSRMEGQSLAMLQAMSFGRMIISTKVGDARRLVLDNETGFLIEALTESLLDEALERAWGRREEWMEFGRKSRTHLFNCIKNSPIDYFADKLLNLV